MDGAAEKLFVAVASELASEGAGFVVECKECRLDVIVLECFEAERPVVTGRAVDEDEGEFVSSDGDTIAKSDVDMNYVKVFGDEAIYRFATWCFWDCCVCAKGQWELASVEKGTVFASGDDVLVITETAASGKTMKFLRGERCLCFGGVGGVAWTDRRWTGVGVMKSS